MADEARVVERSGEFTSVEALRHSQAILQSVADGTTDAVFVKDTSGRYLMCNAAACRFLGRSPDEILGRDDAALLSAAESRALMERDAGVIAMGLTQTAEETLTIDGLVRTFLATKGPVRNASGKVVGLFGISRDITERVRTEEALRESEHLLRESQRVASIGSYRTDFVAGTWKSSEVLDQIFGIDAGHERSVTGWVELIHPDDQAMMARYLTDEVLGKGCAFDKVYRVQRKSDGAERWVHGLGALEFDAGGAVVGMTGTIQDITAHQRAEQAIRESDERHRAMLATALDGFWVVDLEGHIIEVNETYCRMSGYTADELLSMHVSEIDAIESPEDVAARTRDIMARGEARFESKHRRKDGSAYDVAISVQYRPVDGGTMVAFVQDITAYKHAEAERIAMQAQLQHAQKMESVGRLAGGVAHDFNNMLGVILGNAELAIAQVDTADPLRADLEEIRDAALRSVDLTRQLLAFARKQTVAPKVLDLNETVAGMLKMLQRLIGEDIELTWSPAADLGLVKVDPSQVDQILANLCVNARDAITGVGRLTIETGGRTITKLERAGRVDLVPGDYVTLSVSDDGTGMDEATLSHLFEPFFTTKSLGKGTGLGLATVWGIVQQNEGFIEVSSEPGLGTTFRICLPRYVGKTGQGGAADQLAGAQRGHETILVAEDEPGILALAGRMLERQGYNVLRAATPGEAIRLAKEYAGEIHLLMTDVVMPEMNGRDLAKNLLSLYPTMKRLFMSGYTADVIAHRGVLDGGVHFIQKPFTQDALTKKVREALDHERDA